MSADEFHQGGLARSWFSRDMENVFASPQPTDEIFADLLSMSSPGNRTGWWFRLENPATRIGISFKYLLLTRVSFVRKEVTQYPMVY